MVDECGSYLAKYILCIFNFMIFLVGAVILGSGIWLLIDKNSFIGLTNVVSDEELQQLTKSAVINHASYILIATGGFIFAFSFIGYCGAARESQCLLTTYGISLITILVLEIAAICITASYRYKIEEETRRILKMTVAKYFAKPEEADAVTVFWDKLQAKLHCCGVDDYNDFKSSLKWTISNKVLPASCCVSKGDLRELKPNVSICTINPDETNSYYKMGCYQAVMNLIKSHANIVLEVGIALGLLELVGILLAFALSKSISCYEK